MVYGRDGIDGNDGMGRDGKSVVKIEQWSHPVPSRRQFHLPLTRTVPSRRENLSRCTLPSRPVEDISPYRPVSSTKPAPTVSSCLRNLPLPYHPVVKTCPYRPVPPSKPVPNAVNPSGQKLVPTVPPGHSLPSLLLVKMP